MNINRRNITLMEDTYAYVYRDSEKEISEDFKKNLTKYIDIINNLVNQDLKNLSDEEFYDLLCKVYSISLTEEDYLEIITNRNNKKYNRFIEIGTFMTFTDIATEGHGRDFSWWEQLYQVRYIIAVSEDTDLEYDCILTKEEIKTLLENKSIVIVGSKSETLNDELKLNEQVEKLPLMNLKFSYSFGSIHGSICKDENFSIIASMLRKEFTKKRIFKDLKDYLDELQGEMDVILSRLQHEYAYEEISKLCNEWYENSDEKEKFKSLKIKLNDKQV